MGKTQLNFLRLLSEKATQMINITCTGSQGCFDRNSNIVEKAIKLQGANDGVLSFMKDDDSSIKITQVIIFTALFTNVRILKFKSQLTIVFFTAVNHRNGPLRKQNFTSTPSVGHGL